MLCFSEDNVGLRCALLDLYLLGNPFCDCYKWPSSVFPSYLLDVLPWIHNLFPGTLRMPLILHLDILYS